MAQKIIKHTSKWLVERTSADRFVFNSIPLKLFVKPLYLLLILLFSCSACGEPEIKLDRAARRTIDTLVNYQLDSIGPMLDSLCKATKDDFIQQAVDSIMQERRQKEERLRLNSGQ